MKRMTRRETIDALRAKLMEECDDEHSICDVAARKGIFCHGFAQWTFTELKRRYPTIVRSRPALTPDEMRELANRWQLARQTARELPMSCDVQMHEGAMQTCKGWDEWPSPDLAHFYEELFGEPLEVIDDASTAKP